ncbi:hypothetical protein STAN_1773 [Streptomyces sp. CBMAI 2042]|uniref:hypothetical protein n=1 Tax=Streptomyces sp. CBMAI 2042 TaxID=2305222 RepID=UPI000F1DA5A1|nr:hypothetical protein [Streptomyces sp. CBMAI 2042]RLV66252.1 hypothetical protein STAN_1773 [Streptomyces sp. CBMAI 2042]
MAWVVGTGLLLGLLLIAMGTVTLRTGWIMPTARRHVTRPQLHGIGALLMGASLVLQSLLYFGALPSVSWETRFYGGNALLLGGMLLLIVSQALLPRRRDPT